MSHPGVPEPEPEPEAEYALGPTDCTYSGPPAYFNGGPPHFVFPFPCPRLDTPLARASAAVFGSLFATVAVLLAVVIVRCRRTMQLEPFFALLASFAVAVCRAVFFLADPYHIWERMPAALNGVLYGVVYPLRNVVTCMAFFSLYSLVEQTKAATGGTAWRPSKLRKAFAAMNVLEFLIQLFSDVVRGGGYTWYLLNICRMWFVGWGIALSVGFSTYVCRLWLFSAQSALPGMRRLYVSFLCFASFSLLTCATSCFYLSQPNVSLDTLMALFDVDSAVELGQCTMAALLFVPAALRRACRPAQIDEELRDGASRADPFARDSASSCRAERTSIGLSSASMSTASSSSSCLARGAPGGALMSSQTMEMVQEEKSARPMSRDV